MTGSLLELIALQLAAAGIGIAVQTLVARRAGEALAGINARRITGGAVALVLALAAWAAVCMLFKILTWHPFSGDTRGSVELTNILLFAGSAAVGYLVCGWSLRRGR